MFLAFLFAVFAQKPPAAQTDLDTFMVSALHRRDIDRQTLSDYVLDETEVFEVLGPGRVPVARTRRDYTWYVRDGYHVRSPLKADGTPVPEAERRAYEERWLHSEEGRRKHRTEREAKREQQGKPPMVSVPSINEPRFVSESYFMDFKFEPGNYYLAGKKTLDGTEVLQIDYLPDRLFAEGAKAGKKPDKDQQIEDEIDRKMDKTSQITLWVDPATKQIVKYTFNNVWLDFLPAGWLVKIDDLRAQMRMGQPFPGIWLPKNINIHAGVTIALGSMELQYRREFSNYRRADVTSKITVPKKHGGDR